VFKPFGKAVDNNISAIQGHFKKVNGRNFNTGTWDGDLENIHLLRKQRLELRWIFFLRKREDGGRKKIFEASFKGGYLVCKFQFVRGKGLKTERKKK